MRFISFVSILIVISLTNNVSDIVRAINVKNLIGNFWGYFVASETEMELARKEVIQKVQENAEDFIVNRAYHSFKLYSRELIIPMIHKNALKVAED